MLLLGEYGQSYVRKKHILAVAGWVHRGCASV